MPFTYYVYMLASKPQGVVYIGFTSNLTLRVAQHKSGEGGVFSSKYKVFRLVYFEEHPTSYDAFVRERQLKKWHRAWKVRLIEEQNPEWLDLAADWELD